MSVTGESGSELPNLHEAATAKGATPGRGQTIAQRLPSNMRLMTSVGAGQTQMALSITLENADQARALVVALETVMVPLFELTEAGRLQKPEGE